MTAHAKNGYATKKIGFGIYPFEVEIVIALDMEKAIAYFKRRHGVDLNITEKEGYTSMVNGKITMLLPRDARGEVVVHECVHAVCFGLDWIGVKYGDGENNEILAYPIGYLSRAVFNFMHDYRTQPNKGRRNDRTR
jgi:hypothetical protein